MLLQGKSSKSAARLEQWRIIRVREGSRHLIGFAWGHPHLRDGARIVSSTLIFLAPDRSRAETMNTCYSLGAPGVGELPADWAERLDYFLRRAWGTSRIGEQ